MAYLWEHPLFDKRKGQQSPKGLLANMDLISDSKVIRFYPDRLQVFVKFTCDDSNPHFGLLCLKT